MNKKNPKIQVLKYVSADFIAASVAWVLFFLFRKRIIEAPLYEVDLWLNISEKFYMGLAIIPMFWLLMYYVGGEYHQIYRKSRLQELGRTLFLTAIGVVGIFFVLILDDTIISYRSYYQSFFFLMCCHFTLTYFPRLYITTRTIHKLQNKVISYPTLIIGSNERAMQLYNDLKAKRKSAGIEIVGFITVNGGSKTPLSDHIPYYGKIEGLIDIINDHGIEEVIIAIEPSEREKMQQILIKTKATNVFVKAIPDLLDILTGSVKMSSIYGAPLIELTHDLLPAWQENLKRVIDVLGSLMAIIILIPFYLFLAIGVKLSSRGPILYSHKRVGRYAKEFSIYKFRSMCTDAERNGPALSSKDDPRITPFGLFMRKMRFDEVPQFFNVLKGDMSLVGPRPERQYFIGKIAEKAPHYMLLFKVRPGITSWGQVKFGYAENVDEMVERLKYDIIYLENMSLYVDLKIMIYTIKTIAEASGK